MEAITSAEGVDFVNDLTSDFDKKLYESVGKTAEKATSIYISFSKSNSTILTRFHFSKIEESELAPLLKQKDIIHKSELTSVRKFFLETFRIARKIQDLFAHVSISFTFKVESREVINEFKIFTKDELKQFVF